MSLLSQLKELGCNIDEGLERMMNKEDLYIKMLKKFPTTLYGDSDRQPLPVIPLIDSNDISAAEKNAHTLKGVTGNLSLTPLYTAYTDIVNLLRANELEQAKSLALKTETIQKQIIDLIVKA